MSVKYIIKSKAEFAKWCNISNLFAKSLCPFSTVLKEFNRLTGSQRNNIKITFASYDQLRKKKIPQNETEAWQLGIMVDAHIIACEYDIDPLTVILCINPICRANERIIVK